MNFKVEVYVILAIVLFLLIGIMLSLLLIRRLKNDEEKLEHEKQKKALVEFISGKLQKLGFKFPLAIGFEFQQSIKLNRQNEEKIKKTLEQVRLEKKYIRQLRSWFRIRRMEAAVYLGFLGTDNARLALEKALLKEKLYPVKLYIANALSDIKNEASLPVLVFSLFNAHRWYREKVNMLIADFGKSFNAYLPQIVDNQRMEIKELIVDFASVYFSEEVKNYLIQLIDSKNEAISRLQAIYGVSGVKSCSNCMYATPGESEDIRTCPYYGTVKPDYYCGKYKKLPLSMNLKENYHQLVYKAADILARYYPQLLDDEKYLHSEDIELKNIAVKALANFHNQENIGKLLTYVRNHDTARSAVNALSLLIKKNPTYINIILQAFAEEKDLAIKQRLAEILSIRIEYFIMKLITRNKESAAQIIKQILLLGRTSEIIDFLNKNKNIEVENELVAIIREVVTISENLKREFSRYLCERVAYKCRIVPQPENEEPKVENKDKKLISNIYLILLFSLLIFPLIYVFRHHDLILHISWTKQLEIFVIECNYYLAFYFLAINLIYLVLLMFSFFHVNQQERLWRIKNSSFLFKKKILPSVSIIAPAYNEEKTIIESANSLLNLKYPDYELIIVNDRSKDKTLNVLIQYYDLIRVDHIFEYKLNTKPIRGIYMNPSIPKLVVVDKENGGKADSLNAGINISRKEYFCGIDADSLLEDDALLKLASLVLDEGVETPALGGNVLPVNGCTIERGQITNVRIPQNHLARFQTIEYIRAFMAGRLGWAKINSLLIISGAFGLFRKERVIRAGGYLTSRGKYAKDTVGEDMELVVRINRLMREMGFRYRIRYAYNANCWTEVPEDLKSLKRQRYRWHRGLIENLTIHKRMIFNPRYGRIGLLAIPYFLLFEMFGPLVEIQGYLMVFIVLIIGILNAEVVLLLFISNILLGILISLSSLFIAEKNIKYLRWKDLMILLAYAILENFGPRQLFSFWRVGGTISMLKKPTGWGKPERKGFAAANHSAKG
ncbi:glycosyltransferase [Petrotoga sp. SL27]|uniref:glycosyltransferase n=1 Tax=Petrotoga sp. SL27 TaxID=1445612 RepID=UPI000CDEB914|nr:glycosyltransferase [Petrotoga sp. SL27]